MKRKVSFVALFLCTLMTFAQFSGSGSGTENDPYLILNPFQLNQLRNFLNTSNVYFKLMANIDLTEFLEDESPTQGWQPIGNSSSACFKGTLDGNGKTISGLWINRGSTDHIGLFGYTDGATIKNLKMIDASIVGANYTGGVSGRSKHSTFESCSFSGLVTGASYIGGYVGYGSSNNFSSCLTINCNVMGLDYIGGVCGYGDIAGGDITFTNCHIYSNVTGANYVGGILGYCIRNFRSYLLKLTSCSFVGDISATSYAGGLIGDVVYSSNASEDCIVTKCFVIGKVMATSDYVGGLLGYSYRLTISHNYFNGIVSGKNNVGGVVGYNKTGKVSCCYATGSVAGANNVGGLVGYNDASTVKTSVAIHSRISASEENLNRIVGYYESGTIAAVGSTEENKSYNRTIVMLKGAAQEIEDDEMNGTGVSANTLKLKATYVAMGWDFTDIWAIQETECYPYMQIQTAPPVITSNLVSNATTISGKCIDGGTVTMELDGETKKQISVGHTFSFDVQPLISGHTVRICAVADGKEQSYYTEQVVSYPGKGTEADPYLVYTADDLTGVYRKGYYKLMNDIDLTEWINTNSPTEGWTGIGRDGSDMSQFDGNGFTISGLWSNSTRDYMGLFSMFSNGTIKNLTVKTASGKKVKGGNCTGILIGYNTKGRILDCTVEGNVEGTTNVGGIVGSSKNNELTNLVFNGTATSSADSACIGGIVGVSENDQITGIYSDATMTTSGASANMGGIAGNANSNIAESVSKGVLTATGSNAQVGGIVGTSQVSGVVKDCYSSATLSSTYAAAGIVSYNYGTVTRSLATGNLSTRNYAAGVVGYNDGASAIISKSVATNKKIDVVYESQQVSQGGGYGQRILGGLKNDAPAPEMDNYALKTMQVSVNDVSQKVYDDIMNGTSKTAEELNTASTYTDMGWNFTSTWYMNASTGLPDLKVNLEKTEQTLALTEIPVMKYGDGTYQLPVQTNEGLALTWTIGNNNVASISGYVLTIKKAGTTHVSATQEGNSDYKAFNKSFALTVAKAPLTITAQNCSKNVGEANPSFTASYEGFVGEDDASVLTTQPIFTCEATVESPVGTYDINVSGAEAANYEITYVKGTLKVVDEHMLNNTLSISNTEVCKGRSIALPVNLNNTENITALQFEVSLPNGVTISKCQLTDRKGEDHTASCKKLANGNYQVTVISLSKAVFSGTEGTLVNLTLDVDENMTADDYPITLTNIELTTATTQAINPADVTATLTVSNVKIGDTDGNGRISITDAVAIVSHILGEDIDGFVAAAADVDGSGRITITDAVAIVDMILNGTASGQGNGQSTNQGNGQSNGWANGQDVTSLLQWKATLGVAENIDNPAWQGFSYKDADTRWEFRDGAGGERDDYFSWGVYNVDTWNVYQTFEIPAGVYTLKVAGAYREGSPSSTFNLWKAGEKTNNAFVYVKVGEDTYETPLMYMFEGAQETPLFTYEGWQNDGSFEFEKPGGDKARIFYPSCHWGADKYIENGNWNYNEVCFSVPEKMNITVGIDKRVAQSQDNVWWDDWRMIYEMPYNPSAAKKRFTINDTLDPQ